MPLVIASARIRLTAASSRASKLLATSLEINGVQRTAANTQDTSTANTANTSQAVQILPPITQSSSLGAPHRQDMILPRRRPIRAQMFSATPTRTKQIARSVVAVLTTIHPSTSVKR